MATWCFSIKLPYLMCA